MSGEHFMSGITVFLFLLAFICSEVLNLIVSYFFSVDEYYTSSPVKIQLYLVQL